MFFLQQEELSPEEQLAEKLRVKKLQEDADLELAKDAFGKTGSTLRFFNFIYLFRKSTFFFLFFKITVEASLNKFWFVKL